MSIYDKNSNGIVPQGKEQNKSKCLLCRTNSVHVIEHRWPANAIVRNGVRGMLHRASYKCSEKDCGYVWIVEEFVPYSVKTLTMFPDEK